MSKKIVKVCISNKIYDNFFLSGTVIDRPGMPLLKVIDAVSVGNGKMKLEIEVSPTSSYNKKRDN